MTGIRINRTKVVWNPEAVGEALTSDPRVAAMLVGLAQEIVDEAQSGLIRAAPYHLSWDSYHHEEYKGRNWLADTDAVAKQIKVKDQSEVFALRKAFVKKAKVTRVALAISDHPYSKSWEFGLNQLQPTAFMRRAVAMVAARHGNTKRRHPKGAMVI